MADVVLEVEVGILDPVRVVEAERHLDEALAERPGHVQLAADVVEDALERDPAAGRGGLVADVDGEHVTRRVRRLEVEERRVHPRQLLHLDLPGEPPRSGAADLTDPATVPRPPARPRAGRPVGADRGRGGHRRADTVATVSDTPLELNYPAQLPITERRAEIVAALRDHRVVVVAGETGSGKSTQLPKLCLEAGRGVNGMIGHTQPRRLAARTIAERIAEELGVSARWCRRLRRALHRPGRCRHADQGDDRRDPARRDPARPDAASLRHDHRRRGPRAQPEHRLPARLPAPPARAARRPARRHHLGDDRHRALRRALRRRAGDRGQRADVPGRHALPAVRRRTPPTRTTGTR